MAKSPKSLADLMLEQARRNPGPVRRAKGWSEAGAQLHAGAMGMGDVLLFGKGKEVEAAETATRILGGPGMALLRPAKWKETYNVVLQYLAAQEQYDREHRKAARTTGKVVGAVVGLVGAPEIALARGVVTGGRTAVASRRLAEATPALRASIQRTGRNLTKGAQGTTTIAAGGGAAAGLGAQAASDAVTGQISSPLEYGKASASGLLDGIATKFLGNTVGGALAGASDSALQNVIDGEPISVDEMLQAAVASRMLGATGNRLTTNHVRNLTPYDKGQVGEIMSLANSAALGRIPITAGGKLDRTRVDIGSGRASIPDHRLAGQIEDVVEAKMGPWANFTGNQRVAIALNPERYRVDHWLPEHLGNAAGVVGNTIGTRLPGVFDQLLPQTDDPNFEEERFYRKPWLVME